MTKVLFAILLSFSTLSARAEECEVVLDPIRAENEMIIEMLSIYRHRIEEVSNIDVKDVKFSVIETGLLPPEGCAFRYEWTGTVEFRGKNTAGCLVGQPITRKMRTIPGKKPEITFEYDLGAGYYVDCP